MIATPAANIWLMAQEHQMAIPCGRFMVDVELTGC